MSFFRWKIFLLIAVTALTAPFLAAADVPETACNDGTDNDNDGLVDENDPGCMEPYYTDNSEKLVYDMDASWVFSGDSSPTNQGPSIFQPASVINETVTDTLPDSGTGNSGEVREYYIEDTGSADSDKWGQGEIKSNVIDISGATVEQADGENFLVDPPLEGECGDGVEQSGENP